MKWPDVHVVADMEVDKVANKVCFKKCWSVSDKVTYIADLDVKYDISMCQSHSTRPHDAKSALFVSISIKHCRW